jgi:hypothetical protein
MARPHKLFSLHFADFLHPRFFFYQTCKYYPTVPILNTHNQCPSHDKDPCPYKTKGKIIVWYILALTFFDTRQEMKDSELNGSKRTPIILRLEDFMV